MRNLQKILALVLALVMSLSLMATAGATDFSDADQIDDLFEESVNVLDGLEVFQGYPTGDFQPKGEITRAEVAAIIYRIATGDVDDTQKDIYADYNKFSDVYASETYSGWAAGYINYCANAEYIKGRGDGKFYPQDKVTGYEALAMILRVVGYDKNGEFTGNDWAVQTAAIANQRHVTDNINAGLLGQPATREMVAEILCKAILLNTVNYTLAYGYQISTNPQDTIAYQTFKMEQVEGVVTGNEIADLENTSPMTAGQTRLVIDGEKKTMEFTTDLDDIGMKVRAYLRPQSGTTVKELVSGQTYGQDDLNKVYTTGDKKTVNNSVASSEGITSIDGAEHFVNYDYATEWTAKIRITYDMYLRMSEYDAHLLVDTNDGTLYAWDDTTKQNVGTPITNAPSADDDTIIRVPTGTYNYHYTKTINAFSALTDTDWDYMRNFIFAKSLNNLGKVSAIGEVYIGTHDTDKEDVSDDIRWEDFVAAYLESKENAAQISSNDQGCTLKVIDNDLDGIAEYVLQTKYTVAKVAANGTGLDIAALKLTDGDSVNEVSASDSITPVKGLILEADPDYTPAAGDVVIYAKIDGKVRAQKAETETSRVTSINRSTNPRTATIESGEHKESWVHGNHSNGLQSYMTNMVIGTNYTVYFDLYGNIAAYEEGDVGQFVLITDGWYRQAVSAREYAIQAYIDGALKTVDITNNGGLFIESDPVDNNSWNNLKALGGTTGALNTAGGDFLKTTVALLENNNLVPVDKSYTASKTVRMLDMTNNVVPNQNGAGATIYSTNYNAGTAYTVNTEGTTTVFGRSDTVYYYVYKTGTNSVTGQPNYVVRTYTGYSNIPSINPIYIEDVYAVGTRTTYNNSTITVGANYSADVVVVELNDDYKYQNTNSEQVFIPGAFVVNNSLTRAAGQGWDTVPMIRGTGEYQADVKVDLTHSTGAWSYDEAQGRNFIAGGLYYMDPTDTDPSVYIIRKMTNADIRANNYLTGYVAQDSILENNYVRVDVQMPNAAGNGTESSPVLNGNLNATSKRVDPANEYLYTLSYSGNAANPSKAASTTVFDQWKDRGMTNTTADKTNELYDMTAGRIVPGAENRNEVLVRYNGNDVVWAISFAEKNGSSQNYAQTVWYNNLVARDNEVSANVKFFGVSDWTGGDATGDTNNAARYITIPYAAASDPILNFSNAFAATIGSYDLWKWNAATGDYGTRIYQTAEAAETKAANVNGAKYKLEVTFKSGGSETWYLELLAQVKSGALTHVASQASNIRVVGWNDNCLYAPTDAGLEAAKADGANKANVWIRDPNHFDIAQLEQYLTFTDSQGNPGKVEVVYVANGVGEVVETDKVISNAINFGNGNQTSGKIVVKVTNRDGDAYYIQLSFSTSDMNSVLTLAERKERTKNLLREFILKRAKADFSSTLTDEQVLKFIEADNGTRNDAGTTYNGIKTEWDILNGIIDGMTDPDAIDGLLYYVDDPNAAGVTENYKSNVILNGDWPFMDKRDGTLYSASSANLKAALVDEIGAYASTVSSVMTAQAAAKARIDQLANNTKTDTNAAAVEAAVAAGKTAIDNSFSSAAVTAAEVAASKAIRDLTIATVTLPSADEIATESATGKPFAGIASTLWTPESITQEGSTIKITGDVYLSAGTTGKVYNSSNWPTVGMGAWSDNKTIMDGKFGQNNQNAIIVALKVGNEVQFISIGDANAAYAKAHNVTYTVTYPNAPTATVLTLDISGLNFQ